MIEAVPDKKGLGSQQSQVNQARFQIKQNKKINSYNVNYQSLKGNLLAAKTQSL